MVLAVCLPCLEPGASTGWDHCPPLAELPRCCRQWRLPTVEALWPAAQQLLCSQPRQLDSYSTPNPPGRLLEAVGEMTPLTDPKAEELLYLDWIMQLSAKWWWKLFKIYFETQHGFLIVRTEEEKPKSFSKKREWFANSYCWKPPECQGKWDYMRLVLWSHFIVLKNKHHDSCRDRWASTDDPVEGVKYDGQGWSQSLSTRQDPAEDRRASSIGWEWSTQKKYIRPSWGGGRCGVKRLKTRVRHQNIYRAMPSIGFMGGQEGARYAKERGMKTQRQTLRSHSGPQSREGAGSHTMQFLSPGGHSFLMISLWAWPDFQRQPGSSDGWLSSVSKVVRVGQVDSSVSLGKQHLCDLILQKQNVFRW